MTEKKSFILHFDSLDVLEELSKEQIADLFIAIKDYNLWKEVKLSGLMKAVFIPFKNQFDRDNEKYNNIVERNKANGFKWWRPKTKETQKTQSVILKPKKADNDNDNDNVNVNVNDNVNKKQKKGIFQETKVLINKYLKDKDEEFKETFYEFLEIRKKKGAVNSNLAIKNLINKI